MSLPKAASSPPLSSSPSKQSIRRASSRPHGIDQPATAQQTHEPTTEDEQFHHQDTIANTEPRTADEERQNESQSISQSSFQPFFTLIEDAHTSEYYHPNVHYIFSDDDTDIVTEAALRALDNEQDGFPQSMKGKGKSRPLQQLQEEADGQEAYDEEGGLSGLRNDSLLPDPIPGVRDNYIILDVDYSSADTAQGEGGFPEDQGQISQQQQGQQQQTNPQNKQQAKQQQPPQPHHFTVASAHSLSPTWQVLNTQLAPAPTFENSSSGEQPLNGGLMLQIQGTAGLPMSALGKEKERGGQRLEDMMDQFAKRLDELKQVIENGERGMPSQSDQALAPPLAPEFLSDPSVENPQSVLPGTEVEGNEGGGTTCQEQKSPGIEGLSRPEK